MSGSWATPEAQREIVLAAEELGYHSAWTFQRLLFPPDPQSWAPVYASVLDPMVCLAFLAGQTERIRLGVAVLNMPFFSPALLAKQATSVDILSAGRLDLGLGLGWRKEEFAASGIPYERRGARGEEFVAALKALWQQEITEFHGDFYDIPPARMDPRPVQRPHPPLILAGAADRALHRAGRIADGWVSSSATDLDQIAGSIGIVRNAAREAGRDPAALRFVCRGVAQVRAGLQGDRKRLTGSHQQIRSDVEWLGEQGVTEVFLDLNYDPQIGSPDADPGESVRRAQDVLAELAP